jgi:phage-related protein
VSPKDKPLVWLHGEVKTPPFSEAARIEAGFLLRRLQRGELLSMPYSRPMPSLAARCHELRITDSGVTWRIIYRIDTDAIVIADVFPKKTEKTPDTVIRTCLLRLKDYEDAFREAKETRGKGVESRKRKRLPGTH